MVLRRRLQDHVARREPVLGTVLTMQVRMRKRADGARAEALLLEEIERLEAVYSVFRPDSELGRWRRATDDPPVSAELGELLTLGLEWQSRSGGTFNPAIGEVSSLWQRAALDVRLPSDAELDAAASRLHGPRYAFEGDRPVKIGDCSALNLNALAKGLVVERACTCLTNALALDELVVNIGGDLRHVGHGGLVVAIEDPARPYDNAEPLARVRVNDAGLATSGSSRRGVRIGDRWFSHVIDPRTARPVEHVTSASVIAPDAATADVVATVLSVLDPREGLAFVAANGPWSCCVVDERGGVHTNERWDAARC